MLFTDLSGRQRSVLDAFEDDRSGLREIPLTYGGRGLAYVWPDGEVRENEDWGAEQFGARQLKEYAARCARIAPRLAAEAGQ